MANDNSIPGGNFDQTQFDPILTVVYEASSGENLVNNSSLNLGSFIQNTTRDISLSVANQGGESSILDISQSGISLSLASSGSIPLNPSTSNSINLTYLESVSFNIRLNTSSIGNKQITLNIISNDPDNPLFVYTFFFSVVSPSEQNSDIAVIYKNSQVQTGSVVNLGIYPQDGLNDVSFEIFNYAIPTLIIPQDGIDISLINGNEIFVDNDSESGQVLLEFNQNSTIKIRLDTSSVGSKSAIIVIASNDPDENPFLYTISYSVAKPYEISVKESSEEVDEGQTVNLGSFNKKTIINKNITISNKGVSYGIRLLSISSTGDASLANIPSLPYVLRPNEVNTLQFSVLFNSSILGKRTGAISVQWEVAA